MAGKQRPLALPAAAHTSGASGWRRGAELVDALPYIDAISSEEKQMVEALIEDEARRSAKRPSDYLAELPPMKKMQFDGHPVLATEYERVRSKQPMAPLDTSRFRLDPPPQPRRNDLGAWQASLANAQSQLEHQGTRIQNLELLLKYGDKGWRAQTQLQEAALKQVEADLSSTRAAVTALNQQRKLAQLAAGGELRKLGDEFMALVAKNRDIEGACGAVQAEIDALKARGGGAANAGGPAPPTENNGTQGEEQGGGGQAASSGTGQGAGPGAGVAAAANGNGGTVHGNGLAAPVVGVGPHHAAGDGEGEPGGGGGGGAL